MPSFKVGLDLGQGQDYSALVVVERLLVLAHGVTLADYHRRPAEAGEGSREELHVRALRRWELGTSYPGVVADVTSMMRAPALRDALLFIDATGVGRAVVDMFAVEWKRDRFGCARPQPITVTGGRERNGANVPKADLFASVLVPLQQGRLKVADGLALGPVLEHELLSFRQKITASGRDSIEFERRAGDGHGDLVSALSLATFWPNTYRRPSVVERPTLITEGI